MLCRLAAIVAADAGVALRDVDGLIVHDTRPGMGALTLVEMLGLRANFVDRVDHDGATGVAMIGRAGTL